MSFDSKRDDFKDIEHAEIVGVIREQSAYAMDVEQSGVLRNENSFAAKLKVGHPLQPALHGLFIG
jgi:hypothetical protein